MFTLLTVSWCCWNPRVTLAHAFWQQQHMHRLQAPVLVADFSRAHWRGLLTDASLTPHPVSIVRPVRVVGKGHL